MSNTNEFTNRLGITGDAESLRPTSANLNDVTVDNQLRVTANNPQPDYVLAAQNTSGLTTWRDVNSLLSPVIYRLNVDPTSNPGMIINGLLVDSTSTYPAIYNVPLTAANQGLDIGNAFVIDAYNSLTLNSVPGLGITSVTCNRAGYYRFTISVTAVSPILNTSNSIMQVLRNGNAIFMAPGVANAAASINIPLTAFPGMIPFQYAGAFNGSGAVQLVPGDTLSLVMILDQNTIELALTSNLLIERIC